MTMRILSQIGKPAKTPMEPYVAWCKWLGMTPAQWEWIKIHKALDAYNLRTGRGKAR